MFREFQRSRFWIAANLAGAALFLWLASKTWIEPELRGEDVARGGDAVVWLATALPVLAAFFVVNLIWLAVTFAKLAKARAWAPILPLAVTGLLWLFTVRIDLAMR